MNQRLNANVDPATHRAELSPCIVQLLKCYRCLIFRIGADQFQVMEKVSAGGARDKKDAVPVAYFLRFVMVKVILDAERRVPLTSYIAGF